MLETNTVYTPALGRLLSMRPASAEFPFHLESTNPRQDLLGAAEDVERSLVMTWAKKSRGKGDCLQSSHLRFQIPPRLRNTASPYPSRCPQGSDSHRCCPSPSLWPPSLPHREPACPDPKVGRDQVSDMAGGEVRRCEEPKGKNSPCKDAIYVCRNAQGCDGHTHR